MTDLQNQQPAPSSQASVPEHDPLGPRVRRTHTSPETILAFKKLSLFNKLTLNKEINQANLARERKHIDHLMDPVANSRDGSPAASRLTIEPEEIEELRVPSVLVGLGPA